ncbi:hypothetical protein RJT34_13281 [Clitoria ternatea]|uniref:Uncharacterized protein n=1 Tax=Clitoria ternatea TaxID=43366 RepID=A0AAN9JNQ7_CLITE
MNLGSTSSSRSLSLVYVASILKQHYSTKAEGWFDIMMFDLPWKIGLGCCGFSISSIALFSPTLSRPLPVQFCMGCAHEENVFGPESS